MRTFLLFATWSCVSVCSRMIDPPQGADSDALPDPCADGCDTSGTSGDTGDSGTGGGVGPGTVEHVVVLVLDGVRLDETFGSGDSNAAGVATDTLWAPVKDTLLPDATLVLPGNAIGFTGTTGGLGDLLTGGRTREADLPIVAGVGSYRPDRPTLFETVSGAQLVANGDAPAALAESVYPGASGASYAFLSDPADADAPSPDDTDVIDAVKAAAAESPLVVGVLQAVDRTAHGSAGAGAYAEASENLAQPIADLWTWIQSDASGLKDTVLLVVVADHGRHRWGDEFDARNVDGILWDYADHGDQCGGCRGVPMLLAGPGVHRGATVERKYTLEDLAATLAFALGVELPYADGVVIREAFGDASAAADRDGMARVERHGEHQAEQRWTGSSVARSGIVVDGQQLVQEADGIFLAEDPVVFADSTGAVLACWREVEVGLAAAEIDWPWTPACQRYDGSWTKVGFVDAQVAPDWHPALAEHAGVVTAAYAKEARLHDDRPRGGGIALAKLEGGAWSAITDLDLVVPGTPALHSTGERLLLAVAHSDSSLDGSLDAARYTRHVSVFDAQNGTELYRTATEPCPAAAACTDRTPTTDDGGLDWARMESPALGPVGEGLGLAWLSLGDDVSTVHLATGSPSGAEWTTPLRLDSSGKVLPAVAPVIADGVVYWARIGSAGTAEVCRYSPAVATDTGLVEGLSGCADTGSSALRDLAAGGGEVLAVAKAAGAEWKTVTLSF